MIDAQFPLLPEWASTAFDASCNGLQVMHDKARLVSEDGNGINPEMQDVDDTITKVKAVMERTLHLLESVRKAKLL